MWRDADDAGRETFEFSDVEDDVLYVHRDEDGAVWFTAENDDEDLRITVLMPSATAARLGRMLVRWGADDVIGETS